MYIFVKFWEHCVTEWKKKRTNCQPTIESVLNIYNNLDKY